MAFLYRELPAKRKNELQAHLGHCPDCSADIKAWQAGMQALDTWKLPARRPAPAQWVPVLKWAAAAAVILAFGFALGRRSAPAAGELAALKSSVAQLTELVQNQSAASLSNSVAASTTAAEAQTIRLLSEYSRLQEEQRAADRGAVNVALHSFSAHLNKVDADLETVATDTEKGFQETHENITRVASISLADKN
jgi:anti-sigma factor RsiW